MLWRDRTTALPTCEWAFWSPKRIDNTGIELLAITINVAGNHTLLQHRSVVNHGIMTKSQPLVNLARPTAYRWFRPLPPVLAHRA